MNRIQELFRTDKVDPESRNRFLLIAGMVAIVVIALALIAVGYYVDRVEPRGDTVFSVGDREFSYEYLEDRVNAANAQGTFNTQNISFSIAQVVSDIQNEELVRLIAEEEGVTLTDEELESGMKDRLGLPDAADRDTFASALRNRLQFLGLSLGRFEEIVEADVLQQKLQDQIQAGLPSEMEMVDLNVILVETDAAAAAARERIVEGEDFATVAMEVSQHSSAANGGEVGWTPADLLVEDLAGPAFEEEVGELSDVIETERGFYILRVDGKETRELDEEMQAALARAYFNERLEEASSTYELDNQVTVEQAQRIASQLQVTGG